MAALLGAVGQWLYKTGADRAKGAILGYLLNGPILLGLICYAAVMILFIAGFKRGGAPTVLYPIYATTFIWAAVIAQIAYHQPIRLVNVAGMVLLMGGMYLMGK